MSLFWKYTKLNLHEASVFVKDRLNLAICSLASFKASNCKGKKRFNNEMFLIEFNTLPWKCELSVRIAVVFNEAILHRSRS